MNPVSVLSDEIVEAARWHLCARLLERPHGTWREMIGALGCEMPDIVLRAIAAEATAATEGGYLRALGPGGAVPAREVGYCGFRDPGWIVSDLIRFYDAFGFRPAVEDPVDHVAVEAGFVAYLHMKETLARARGDEEAVAVTRAARERFLREHLAMFVPAMAARLGAAEAGYLADVSAFLAARLPAVELPLSEPEETDESGCGC